MSAQLKHVSGLPLAANVPVEVFYGAEKIVFKKDNQEISVSMDKVKSIDCVTGKNLRSQTASGAVAGKYLIGGTTGALIGAAAATAMYLTISYQSAGKDKYIVLDTWASGTFSNKVVKDFKTNHTRSRISIEL